MRVTFKKTSSRRYGVNVVFPLEQPLEAGS
jgi:hypothetical protein